jgi:hypothetical protein
MSIESKPSLVPVVLSAGGKRCVLRVSPRTAEILEALQKERDQGRSALVIQSREIEHLQHRNAEQQKRLDDYSWRDNPGQGMC